MLHEIEQNHTTIDINTLFVGLEKVMLYCTVCPS